MPFFRHADFCCTLQILWVTFTFFRRYNKTKTVIKKKVVENFIIWFAHSPKFKAKEDIKSEKNFNQTCNQWLGKWLIMRWIINSWLRRVKHLWLLELYLMYNNFGRLMCLSLNIKHTNVEISPRLRLLGSRLDFSLSSFGYE